MKLAPSLRRNLYRERARQRRAMIDDLEGFFLDHQCRLRERLELDKPAEAYFDRETIQRECTIRSLGLSLHGRRSETRMEFGWRLALRED